MSDFEYINRNYGLSFKRGTQVEYTGDPKKGSQRGVITSAAGAHVNIRFDGSLKIVGPFHPTWELREIDRAEPATNG